jgi:aspartate carbamoyltransferase catalytic subunit
MNRGVEIAGEVAERDNAVITDQVANGVSVRMAVLYLLLGPGRDALGSVLPAQDRAGARPEGGPS